MPMSRIIHKQLQVMNGGGNNSLNMRRGPTRCKNGGTNSLNVREKSNEVNLAVMIRCCTALDVDVFLFLSAISSSGCKSIKGLL